MDLAKNARISQHFALDTIGTCLFVISPRIARDLYTKDYSILPKNTMDYLTKLLSQILNRCRQHLERRNDFIQMMVDDEDQVKHDEQELHQIGTLTKSNMLNRLCIM
ncbi:unnamed protein product [Adineta steineri]|uniref:Uncharacterized protein n=1 Tax=Adineta steineri TaxID=433720 RepID=A0A819L449_9BILA|nr:unnamed protein product [Adineta steineri]